MPSSDIELQELLSKLSQDDIKKILDYMLRKNKAIASPQEAKTNS